MASEHKEHTDDRSSSPPTISAGDLQRFLRDAGVQQTDLERNINAVVPATVEIVDVGSGESIPPFDFLDYSFVYDSRINTFFNFLAPTACILSSDQQTLLHNIRTSITEKAARRRLTAFVRWCMWVRSGRPEKVRPSQNYTALRLRHEFFLQARQKPTKEGLSELWDALVDYWCLHVPLLIFWHAPCRPMHTSEEIRTRLPDIHVFAPCLLRVHQYLSHRVAEIGPLTDADVRFVNLLFAVVLSESPSPVFPLFEWPWELTPGDALALVNELDGIFGTVTNTSVIEAVLASAAPNDDAESKEESAAPPLVLPWLQHELSKDSPTMETLQARLLLWILSNSLTLQSRKQFLAAFLAVRYRFYPSYDDENPHDLNFVAPYWHAFIKVSQKRTDSFLSSLYSIVSNGYKSCGIKQNITGETSTLAFHVVSALPWLLKTVFSRKKTITLESTPTSSGGMSVHVWEDQSVQVYTRAPGSTTWTESPAATRTMRDGILKVTGISSGAYIKVVYPDLMVYQMFLVEASTAP